MSLASKSDQTSPGVVVVIPTYNRWQEARTTLACLEQSEYRNFEIVLVEDGCSDGTNDFCKKEFPGVHLIHGDGNLWWSGAINKGIEYALERGADAIVWLNDDNRVEPQTLSNMVASFDRLDQRSVICARTKSTDTGLDEWVGEPPRWHPEFGQWTPPDLSASDVPVKHPPGGRGVLIPAQCFREIGLVDQRTFPHYWADHDFHYRAMKTGYHYYLALEAVVWNVPNSERPNAKKHLVGSLRGTAWFLFNRRSSMNMPTMHRLLKRHLPADEYRSTFYPLLRRHLAWLGYEWLSRKLLYKWLRAIKRSVSKKVSESATR